MIESSILFFASTVLLEPFPISSSGIRAVLVHAGLIPTLTNTSCIQCIDHSGHALIACVLAVFFMSRWRLWFTTLSRSWPLAARLWVIGFIVDGLTAVLYLTNMHTVFLLPLYGGFCITTLCLISLYWCPQPTRTKLYYSDSIAIAIGQGIAFLVPGISRLALVYAVLRWRSVSLRTAFETAWIMVFPLYCAAGMHVLWVYWYGQPLTEAGLHFVPILLIFGIATIAWCALSLVWYIMRSEYTLFFAFITAIAAWYAYGMYA